MKRKASEQREKISANKTTDKGLVSKIFKQLIQLNTRKTNNPAKKWGKDRNTDQSYRIESPKIHPCTYGRLFYDKGGKKIQWRKENFFNTWCWENWTATCKRMKLEHSLTPHTKIKSKWIKDLNVRPDTTRLL